MVLNHKNKFNCKTFVIKWMIDGVGLSEMRNTENIHYLNKILS